jgi:hypothetical protein
MMLNELAFNADIDISEYDEAQLIMGMDEESEHEDVTGGDPITTLKIVIAHLKEDPQYYTKLEQAMSKGGPGSGRYPKGSGDRNSDEASDRKYFSNLKGPAQPGDTKEIKDVRAANDKVANLKAKLKALKTKVAEIEGSKKFKLTISDVVSTKAPDPHSPGRIHSDIQDFINDGGSAFDAINIASSKHGISYEEANKIFRRFGGKVTGENV